MSVLIKGMDIPKKGEYRMTLYVCDDGYAYVDVDLFPVDKDRFEAVHVPPHGDLIERDKLREKEFIHDGDAYAVVMSRDIRNAPTIIPASEEVYNVYTDTAGNLHWTGTHSGEHIIQLEEGE